jgi:threonine/homoserine/homoserine lactone efflux protein
MGIHWWTFAGVVVAAYLVPGPDFAVVLRSATRSRRAGVASAAGAQVGLCAHAALAVAGLSVALARHPEALTVVRVVGGTYLLYLAGRLVLPTLRRSDRAARPPAAEASTRSAFAQGLFTNLLNPKAVLFFAAVLPQFVVVGAAPVWAQIGLLGAVDVLLGLLVWVGVVAAGVRLSALLQRQRVRRWWDRLTGVVLGGLGGGLVLSRG